MAHDPLAMRHHDSHAASAHSIFHELNGSSDNLAVRAPASPPCALSRRLRAKCSGADVQPEAPAVATVRLIASRAVQDEIALLRARLAEAEMSREEVVACRAVPGHAVPSHSCQPCCDVEPSMRGCRARPRFAGDGGGVPKCKEDRRRGRRRRPAGLRAHGMAGERTRPLRSRPCAAWSIVGGRLQAQRPPRRCGTHVLSAQPRRPVQVTSLFSPSSEDAGTASCRP